MKLETLFDKELDSRSIEMFNKPYIELSISEIDQLDQYTRDIYNPIWKEILIDNNPSGYMISNIGTVKGKRGEILKMEIGNTGYYRINGYYNKHGIHLSIHRELAKAFIPNPENKPFVNHINGNKLFNWVGNLEWVTHEENMMHAIATHLIDIKGIKHPENVYSIEQIRLACKMLEDPYNKISDIVKETGINRSILYSIRNRISWTEITSEYNIPKPATQEKFDYDKLEKAAQLLSETKLSYNKIHDITGIPPRTLMKIVYGSPGYTDLRSKYIINRKLKRHKAV